MASMATLKLLYTPSLHPSIYQKNPKALLLPEYSNNSWLASKKYLASNVYQTLQQTKKYNAIVSRVASLDVSEVSDKDGSATETVEPVNEVKNSIGYIKALLSTIDDGRISVSPYDTAWVALIKDINGGNGPQFPAALEWIAQHQLSDGSWGDEHYFCAYDRIINTLASVVVLRSWNVHPHKSEKGITYIRENVHKLENADVEHMLCGFEVIFPALLQQAQKLGIDDLPYDAPVVTAIQNDRARKMKKIPKDVMHKVPTSLLFSLEGLEELDWQKLLKLQSFDGSFLTSPSSTAFAFMETGDEKCLSFITNAVEKLNGGAPHTYPVDVFARLWAVDRLQRLGISRYFEPEIKDIMSYMYSVWTEKGVFSGRDSEFCDIDDTSMGFRLLRMYGYDMDPSVFENFRSGNKFSCYGGQIIESSSPIYNLFRASHFKFPGEKILEEAGNFANNFLQEKQEKNELLDKWVISEHLSEEIRVGLDMPWYATLPRVEAKYYLQHYAGGDDVWIGKTLYRMEEISNNTYLELAKTDFKRCQKKHQIEWSSMQEWYENSNVEEFGITRKDLLIAYFLSAATIFEPERSKERVTWAKSQIICRMVTSFLKGETTTPEQKASFLKEFENINGLHKLNREHGIENVLLATVHQFLGDCNEYKSKQLKNTWGEWLMKVQQEGADLCEDAVLLATTLNIFAEGITINEDILSHHEYKTLSNLTNKICQQLSEIQNKKVDMEEWRMAKANMKNMEVEQDMQALVKLVLQESVGGIDRNTKEAFLSVVKTYYYGAYNAAETIDVHMFKVLFEPVV